MTSTDYQRVREMIESRFRQDMAALERVWFTIHGVNPPDSPISLTKTKDDESPQVPSGAEPMRSAAALGIPSSTRVDDRHRTTYRRGYKASPDVVAKRTAKIRAYWAKRKKEKSA